MGRIVVQTRVTNLYDEDGCIECGTFVDTGAGALILPSAWKERLGRFQRSEPVELQWSNGAAVRGEARWPVEIWIEGFRPISNEVIFSGLRSRGEWRRCGAPARIRVPACGSAVVCRT